jgi:hypothetical protein
MGTRKIRISGKNQWTSWFGGECPVPPNCIVEIQKRGGDQVQIEARRVAWSHRDFGSMGAEKIDDLHDVINYRICKSQWQTRDGVCNESWT